MEEFAPYQPTYDELLEATALRFRVNKLMHDLTTEQLAEIINFIAGMPAPKPVPQDYRPKSDYKQAYEPFIPNRWMNTL